MGSGGVFETFRDNGGPILYTGMNRTPVISDLRNVIIWIAFGTLFAIFLIILPGIRKEKISTFISVTVSLFVGAAILVTNCGSSWHVAHASISSPYRAFSREKIHAIVGVYIGLKSVNITLQADPVHRKHYEIDFNERFYWIEPDEMKIEYQHALARGLPYPILTVADYLSQDEEGFGWSRQYRQAGHYTSTILWFSFLTWIIANVLLCAVPRYGAYTLQVTGALMLTSVATYSLLLPSHPLRIPFEGGSLVFHYGASFYAALIAGSVAILVGAIYATLDTLFPNRFSTILQVDYDTPYRYFGMPNDATVVRTLSSKNPLSNSSIISDAYSGIGSGTVGGDAASHIMAAGDMQDMPSVSRNGSVIGSSMGRSAGMGLSHHHNHNHNHLIQPHPHQQQMTRGGASSLLEGIANRGLSLQEEDEILSRARKFELDQQQHQLNHHHNHNLDQQPPHTPEIASYRF